MPNSSFDHLDKLGIFNRLTTLREIEGPISASGCSAESCFQQNSLDEFPTGGREFITALRRP
jgi:hypothetical protein